MKLRMMLTTSYNLLVGRSIFQTNRLQVLTIWQAALSDIVFYKEFYDYCLLLNTENHMSLELNISNLIDETVETTLRLEQRWKYLSSILSILYAPMVLDNKKYFCLSGYRYDFDDFIILMFEFTQLTKIFYVNQESEKELDIFCALHSDRLLTLCINNRLNHIEDIIVFRHKLQGQRKSTNFF